MPTASISPPQNGTLAEEELVSSLSWLITLRWLAGIGVLLTTWFSASVLKLNVPAIPLYLLGVGLLAYNFFLWWILGRLNISPSRPNIIYQWFARVQIGLDWMAMVLLTLSLVIDSFRTKFFTIEGSESSMIL